MKTNGYGMYRPPAKLVDDVAWIILLAQHTNVTEAERPMSWSDLSDEQAQRIRNAARNAIKHTIENYKEGR